MNRTADYYIEQLHLQPHPEGGFFKETYRCGLGATFPGFPARRSVSTGIYFLLTYGNFSAFHRIKSDEMWHFYDGDPLTIYIIGSSGELKTATLGLEIAKGQLPQMVVSAGCWFASRVEVVAGFTLVGCTVAPGFDFDDFEMADRQQLVEKFPEYERVIGELTRE